MTSTHKTYLQMHLDASSNLVLDLSEILSAVYSCEHIQNSNNFNCYDIHARSYLCKHYHYELKRLCIIRPLSLRKYTECIEYIWNQNISNPMNLISILVYNIESCGKSLTVINGYMTIEECRFFFIL